MTSIASRSRWQRVAFLLLSAAVVLGAEPVFACVEETVDHGVLHVRSFEGRILPYAGDELLPAEVEFIITALDAIDREPRRVPLQPNGEFVLSLAPGSYRFKIQAEGFLFTLVGTVVVGESKKADDRLIIQPPWC